MLEMPAARPRAGYSANLLTLVFSIWLLGGLLTDVWAHNNVPRLETFFTPWHAALYSGFLATAGWICWLVRRNLMAGMRGLAAIPHGYGLGLAGVALFLAGGAGDLTWHTVFGIERNARILFSPTHLLLITAISLIITSPLRDAQTDPALPATPGLRRLLPSVLGVALAGAAIMVLLQYANVLVLEPREIVDAFAPRGAENALGPTDVALTVIVTNVALLFPLLIIGRRWTIPFGSATVVYAVYGIQGEAVTALHTPTVLAAIVLGGVGVDLLLLRLRPGPSRQRAYWAFAALAPVVTWAVFFAVDFVVVGRVPSVVEYWTGIPIVAGLLGLLLGAMLMPGAGAFGSPPVGPAATETAPENVPAPR